MNGNNFDDYDELLAEFESEEIRYNRGEREAEKRKHRQARQRLEALLEEKRLREELDNYY